MMLCEDNVFQGQTVPLVAFNIEDIDQNGQPDMVDRTVVRAGNISHIYKLIPECYPWLRGCTGDSIERYKSFW